jgi:cell division protein FtsZ
MNAPSPSSPAPATVPATALVPAIVPAPAAAVVPAPVPAPAAVPVQAPGRAAVLAVGRAGTGALELMLRGGWRPEACLAVSADAAALEASTAERKVQLSPTCHARLAALEPVDLAALDPGLAAAVTSLCTGREFIFLIAGLGGHTGTRLGPLLAQAIRASGTRVIALLTQPFSWEGRSRRQLAQQAWLDLCEQADGVLCLPNQKAEKLVPEGAPVQQTLLAPLLPLAEAARGLWRLLLLPASLRLHWPDVSPAVHGRACVAFASAQATGLERAREVADKLLTHPLLVGTQAPGPGATLLLSVAGGADVRRDELRLLTERIENGWPRLQVRVGLTVDASLDGALSALLLVSVPAAAATETAAAESRAGTGETSGATPESPTPLPSHEGAMIPDAAGRGRRRSNRAAARQEQLPLEIFSRGRFDKSEPTIHKGEDLDVPTYIRRGITLTTLN